MYFHSSPHKKNIGCHIRKTPYQVAAPPNAQGPAHAQHVAVQDPEQNLDDQWRLWEDLEQPPLRNNPPPPQLDVNED